eukprot:tig00020964_g16773.t1
MIWPAFARSHASRDSRRTPLYPPTATFPQLRSEAIHLAIVLLRRTSLAFSERLFSSGLLDAVLEQARIGPDRLLEEIREAPEVCKMFPTPKRVSAYAPRCVHLCTVAAPHGELRLRLARHPGLVPALLHLASAARPVPRLYPEDSTPLYASACLRQLLFAPVVIGDPAAAAPEAPAAPWPPAAASPRGGRLRLVAAGHEGHGAELAAARGAQAAFLAAPGEPVAVLAGALEWCAREGSGSGPARIVHCPDPDRNRAFFLVVVFHFDEDRRQRTSSWTLSAAKNCCLVEEDEPKSEDLVQALQSRVWEGLELGACLADLCVFPEHARAVLPHAPLLQRLLPVCMGGRSGPFHGGYSLFGLDNPEEGMCSVPGHGVNVLRSSRRTRACGGTSPPNAPRWRRGSPPSPPARPRTSRQGPASAFRLNKTPSPFLNGSQNVGNKHFADKDYVLAALVYGAVLGFCPAEARLTRAAALGNRAECNLALGGRARAADAERDAAAALRELEPGAAPAGPGPRGAALAEKARGRLRRARALLAAPSGPED